MVCINTLYQIKNRNATKNEKIRENTKTPRNSSALSSQGGLNGCNAAEAQNAAAQIPEAPKEGKPLFAALHFILPKHRYTSFAAFYKQQLDIFVYLL